MTKEEIEKQKELIKMHDEIQEAIKNLESQPIMYDCSSCTIQPVLSPLDALDKIDHTLCLNINKGNLEYHLDTYNDGPNNDSIDCKDIYELLNCISIIRKALIDKQVPNYIPHIIPGTIPDFQGYYDEWNTKTINYCEGCPNRYGPRDGLGNPTAGDSPCQWCTHNPRKVT